MPIPGGTADRYETGHYSITGPVMRLVFGRLAASDKAEITAYAHGRRSGVEALSGRSDLRGYFGAHTPNQFRGILGGRAACGVVLKHPAMSG